MASLPSQEQWQQQSLELRLWTTFDALLRDTIWGELATQTNAYAEKCLSRLGQDAAAHMDSPYFKQFAHLNNWKAVTANDMWTFAAHLIVLVLVNKLEP